MTATQTKPVLGPWFWDRVDRSGDCWLWRGMRNTKGYGRVGRGKPKRFFYAHRLSHEARYGPLTPDRQLHHTCGVKHCVRPDHLMPVDGRLHAYIDAHAAPAVNRTKTHCAHGHPFDRANTYIARDGGRGCRACNREAVRRYSERKRGRAKP